MKSSSSKIVPPSTTWIKPEAMSEHLLVCISMLQIKEEGVEKTNTVSFHLYEIPRIGKFIKAESRLEVTRS